jgi:hypothetical protein
VEIKESDAPGKPIIPKTLPFRSIFHDVGIARLSILHAEEEIKFLAMQFNELEIMLDQDTDQLICRTLVELANRKIRIVATLPDIEQALASRRLPFTFSAKGEDIAMSADGKIDFMQTVPVVEARIQGQVSDLQQIPTDSKDFILQGELTGYAGMNGTFDRLALKDLAVTWKGPGSSTAQLNGRIDDIIELTGFDLSLTGTLDQPAWLDPILPLSLGPLNSADLSLGISGPYQTLALRDIGLEAKTEDGLDLALAGQLDLRQGETGWDPENINLKLRITAPTTRTARALLFEQVWEFGPLEGRADIRSESGDPSLENIVIQTRDPEGIEVDLSGRINRFPLDPETSNTGYDLDVIMKAESTSIMGERLGVELPLSGPLAVQYRIEGDTRALRLEQIKLSAGIVDEVLVDIKGSVQFGDWSQADPVQALELSVQASSNDTQAPAALLDLKLPELGPLKGQARLHTVSGKHRVDDFQLKTGKGAILKASIIGAAEQVIFFPRPGVNGIRLTATAAADDTAQLNSIFGLQEVIPAIGVFHLSTQIIGSDQKILVSDILMKAGRKDTLLVTGKGRLGELEAAKRWQPQDVDLVLSAQSEGSSPFVELLGYSMPELGSIAATADLAGKNNTFTLESIHIQVGEKDNPALEADGFVNDLSSGSDLRLEVKLDIDGHSLAEFADKHTLPDLQPLTGNMIVSDSDGSLGIDSLYLKSIDPKLLSLQVDGRFDDFKKPDTLVLDLNLSARDLQLVGAIYDLEWPPIGPVTLDSSIKRKGDRVYWDTLFNMEKTQLQAAIDGNYLASPPYISGKIIGRNMFLPDLRGKSTKNDEIPEPAKEHVFSRMPIDFNLLKKVDLDLSVAIESFDKRYARMDSASFDIALHEGLLNVSPATLVFPKGTIQINGQVDARQQPAAGRNFGTWGEIRAGIRRLRGNADVKVGQADLPSYDFDRGEFYLRLSSDELDNRNFPRNGIYGFVEYVASRQTLGADTSFDQFLIDMSGAISWGRNTVQAGGRYFSTIEGYAPVQNRFELGGLFNLSGFKEDELSGQQVGLMRVGYMRRIGDFNLIPTYIGGTLEGGNTWEDRDAMDLDELILVASIYLGLDTFLGPIYLAYGQAENDNKSLYFYLGKIF